MKIRIAVLITLASLGIESMSQNAHAENEPTRKPDVEAVVVKAQQCSTKAAENYAKVAGETADTLAAAAFDKCSDEWAKASKALTDSESVDRRHFSPQQLAADPILHSTVNGINDAASARNSISALREAEIKRLRVVIIDQRLK